MKRQTIEINRPELEELVHMMEEYAKRVRLQYDKISISIGGISGVEVTAVITSACGGKMMHYASFSGKGECWVEDLEPVSYWLPANDLDWAVLMFETVLEKNKGIDNFILTIENGDKNAFLLEAEGGDFEYRHISDAI